ncbi:hypothetical protein [Tamlana flava]|uniref:hypothetical protein n=1 Tax=Tamlana flava TaxID=3158572 RepID=UPI00351B0905
MNVKTKVVFWSLIFIFGVKTIAIASDIFPERLVDTTLSKIEVFTFISQGREMKGKIYLPHSYNTKKSLPAIFLIDFTEQHFKLATDEFEKAIYGINQIKGFNALVVSLDAIPDIDAEPDNFEDHYAIFKDMTRYVDSLYTKNSSRTFIGKGSESGVVLMTLFLEDTAQQVFDNFVVTDPSPNYASSIIDLIEKNNFPKNKSNKKLHFSFSTSNDRTKCTTLIKLITEAKYPWLQFEAKEYKESDFENTYPLSYAEGLKFVFKNDKF